MLAAAAATAGNLFPDWNTAYAFPTSHHSHEDLSSGHHLMHSSLMAAQGSKTQSLYDMYHSTRDISSDTLSHAHLFSGYDALAQQPPPQPAAPPPLYSFDYATSSQTIARSKSPPSERNGAKAEQAGTGERVLKKRGPKKKPFTKEREIKLKVRRARANSRERNRMHSLNDALEELRQTVPMFTNSQRLSKIETLRLARNYISVLNMLLEADGDVAPLRMAYLLTDGLTQNTTNLIAGQLRVNSTDIFHLRKLSGGSRPAGTDSDSASLLDSNPRSVQSNCQLLQAFAPTPDSPESSVSMPYSFPGAAAPASKPFDQSTQPAFDAHACPASLPEAYFH